MLSRIEQKLTSILGDDLATRTHLSVVEAPGPPTGVDAGSGAVLVAVSEMTPAPLFERDKFSFNGAQSRRILVVRFAARIEFFLRPEGNDTGELAAARQLLLDDMSLVSHGLGRETLANGKDFAVSDPDPGFRVLSFGLDTGGINRDLEGQFLTGFLRYRGDAEIWPPGVAQQEGEIRAIDTVMVPLPLEIAARNAVVRAGESASVRVRSLPPARVVTREPPATEALRLAVTVLSDAPPAERGVITSGSPGAETGFRIIAVTSPETAIAYQAPATGISRPRVEYVAIHLATPDAHRGVFLGSIAIRLEAA
jgi:hypothetical protein